MKGTKKFFILFLVTLFTFNINASQNVQKTLLNNHLLHIESQYYPNHSEFKRCISQMKGMQHQLKNRVFSRSAYLIKSVDYKATEYFYILKKLITYYKKKWNKRHYQTMTESWKNNTFSKQKEHISLIHNLMLKTYQSYNQWNDIRNSAIFLLLL